MKTLNQISLQAICLSSLRSDQIVKKVNRITLIFCLISWFQLSAQDFLYTKQDVLKEVRIIKDVDNYLSYKSGEQIHGINKSNLHGYSIKNPVRKRFSDIMVITNQRDTLSGKLLYVSLDSLYLWRGDNKYIPNRGNFKAISTVDIQQLVVHRSGSFKHGFTAGALIGGVVGVGIGLSLDGFATGSAAGDVLVFGGSFSATGGILGGLIGLLGSTHIQMDSVSTQTLEKNLLTLEKNAMLKTPPIYGFNKKSDSIDWSSLSRNMKRAPKTKQSTTVTLSVVGGFELLSAQRSLIRNSLESSGESGTVDNWIWGGATTYPVRENAAVFLDMGMDIQLSNSSKVGLVYTSTSMFGARGLYGATETGKKNGFEFTYQYIPQPYSPFTTSKWEGSLSAGPSINFLDVNIFVPGIGNTTTSMTKPGIVGRGALDYYLTPNLSLSLQLIGRVVPGINVQQYDKIKTHTVNFSSLDLGVGLKVHL